MHAKCSQRLSQRHFLPSFVGQEAAHTHARPIWWIVASESITSTSQKGTLITIKNRSKYFALVRKNSYMPMVKCVCIRRVMCRWYTVGAVRVCLNIESFIVTPVSTYANEKKNGIIFWVSQSSVRSSNRRKHTRPRFISCFEIRMNIVFDAHSLRLFDLCETFRCGVFRRFFYLSRTPFVSKWCAFKTTSKHDTFVHINLQEEYPIVCSEIRKAVFVLFVHAFNVWLNHWTEFIQQHLFEQNKSHSNWTQRSSHISNSALSRGDTRRVQFINAHKQVVRTKKLKSSFLLSFHRISFADDIKKRILPWNARCIYCCSCSNETRLITFTVASSFFMILFKNEVFRLAKSVCHCRTESFSHSTLAIWEIFYSCSAASA